MYRNDEQKRTFVLTAEFQMLSLLSKMVLKAYGKIWSVRYVINIRLTEFNHNLDEAV